jgi:hypothetical protein
MASIDRLLAWLECRLQGLVEGSTSWLLPGGRQRRELAGWLAEVMYDSARRYGDHGWQAPDLFTLTLPTAAVSRLDDALPAELAAALQLEARQRGLVLLHQPVVRVVADPLGQAPRVQVAFAVGETGNTTTQQVVVPSSPPAGDQSQGKAYLVVDGRQTYLLTSPVVTLGRDPGSTVVLDDLRVSRAHAQLRLVQGQYVIFDLQSTGGTTVNGRLVTQHTLAPGDVIALAGVPVVYGQEMPVEAEITQKLPPEPGSPEAL